MMRLKNIFNDFILPVLIGIVITLLINKFLFFQIRVPSESMYPTIKVGDRILVTRVYNKENLKRGDIVVFKSDELGMVLIKRLIGLPGDKIEINGSGEVFINGEKLEQPYVVNNDNEEGTFEVPENHYFFLGDNRPGSFDSRRWKDPYIDGKKIMGKAQFIIYPFRRFGQFVIGEAALSH